MAEKLSDVELDREYRRRNFKGTLIALLIIVIVSIPLLGISYLYCEHLTDQYAGDILSDIRNEVLANDEKLIQFKVLKYKKKAKDSLIPEAAVYIVTENVVNRHQNKMVCELSYRYGQWNIEESTGKSAWPYSYIPDFSISIGT